MKHVHFFSIALLLSCASQLHAFACTDVATVAPSVATCSRDESAEGLQRFLDLLNTKCPNYAPETATVECQEFVTAHDFLMKAVLAKKAAVENTPAEVVVLAAVTVCPLTETAAVTEEAKTVSLVEFVATPVVASAETVATPATTLVELVQASK